MSLRGMLTSLVVLMLASSTSRALAEGAAPAPQATQAAPPPAAPAKPKKKGRYPLPAADYQHKIDERVLIARERMETRIVRRKLSADRAKEVRGRFEISVIEVRKVMADAASDGLITKEEARRVNQSTRGLNRAAARAR